MIDSERATVVHRVCSWCAAEFARERWKRREEAEIITWGICPACFELREGASGVSEHEHGHAEGEAMLSSSSCADGPPPKPRSNRLR